MKPQLKLVAENEFPDTEFSGSNDLIHKMFGWSKPRSTLCPVEPSTVIQVCTKTESCLTGLAGSFDWAPYGNIIFWRKLDKRDELIIINQLPSYGA